MNALSTSLSLAVALIVVSGGAPEAPVPNLPNLQRLQNPENVPNVQPHQRAKHLITVTDDFVVDVYHNGVKIPDRKRKLLLERFGATVERMDLDVRKGDWLVFNVVNNRLRWGGVRYFGVAGVLAPGEFGFVSELESGAWCVCDDPGQVDRFIKERPYLSHNRAVAIERPWGEGTRFMKSSAGANWHGQPLWGRSRNTWVKVRVY